MLFSVEICSTNVFRHFFVNLLNIFLSITVINLHNYNETPIAFCIISCNNFLLWLY